MPDLSKDPLEVRVTALERSVQSIETKIDLLVDRISAQQRPQYGLIISLATFLCLVLGAWGTALILPVKSDNIHLGDSISAFRAEYYRQHEELDTKLQREFGLALDSVKQGTERIDNNSKERHTDIENKLNALVGRIERIENWQDDQAKADLQELRARRMKEYQDGGKKTMTTP